MSEPLLTSAVRAHRAGNLAEAARLYGEILRLEPRQFMALYGLGLLYYQSDRFEQSERLMAEAVRCNPASSESFFTRGCALQRLNRPAEALICFDHALALRPDNAEAHGNRGVALMALNRHAEALESLKTSLRFNASNAALWNNCGCVLVNLGRPAEAIPCFDNALARYPGFAQCLINRGSAHASFKHYAAAIADFERALQLNPEQPYAAGNIALYRMQSSDWRHFDQDKAAIEQGIRDGKRVVLPFVHLALSDSPAEQSRCASIWTENETPARTAPLWRGEIYRHDRIRVAYVSADFHSHATAALMAGVFEQHDRKTFETIAISFGRDDQTPMRARVSSAFDQFIDVRTKSDFEIASLLRRLEIDIAVDLKGYTRENRAGIFAYRPCPVQAAYLGYPGTMGAPFIDYLIADRIVLPEEHKEFYREHIVWLPDSYQCNTAKTLTADSRNRADWGLPEQGFVFCCFNNSFKITPAIFTVWMRLLRAVRGSVLWLLEDNEESRVNLRREAEARGIAADRLVFAPRVSLEEHLARHRHADLFLDTQPYGAHTTASDSLWAGVPVLTIAGSTFSARVAASLLHAASLPELVADNLADYEAAALRLAWEPGSLHAIRDRLSSKRDRLPLFDTARFTRNLEAAYRAMVGRSRRGEGPENFAVENASASESNTSMRIPPAAAAALEQARALRQSGNLTEALAVLDGVLAIVPEFADALFERGATLGDLRRYSESAQTFAKALALDPDQPCARGNLVLSTLRACEWRDLPAIRADAAERIGRGERALAPFVDIALSASPAEQLKCASIWAANEAPAAAPLWTGELYGHEKIRIAYVSGDFHAHATAALMAGVFEHHDRSRFEPIAISYGPDDGSELRSRVKSAFSRFIDVRDRSDSEVAALLREMEIDIAVDLKGYTENNRARIFSCRPAPVQASYLGFPGTMAASWIDYLIADEVVIPEQHRPFYSENIVRLPVSYQCNDSRRPIAAPAPSRAELGLPEQGFVFCCFNGSYKIIPEIFGVWMELLREIQGSVLWLLDDNADAVRNLRREAESRGVTGDRLIFAPRFDVSQHLARHRLADLFLDTLPVGAHTTASDALWAGLPVLTIAGPTFAGRVAASLLTAIGLPELIAQSLDEYRNLALRLARDPAGLQQLKSKLLENRQTHPLFETASFTRNLESAFAEMWERTQRRERPQDFVVRSAPQQPARTAMPIPDAAAAAFLNGCRLIRENDFPRALDCFGQAVSIAPHFVEAQTNRGAVLVALNRPAEAIDALDEAVAINPAIAEAWNNRGNALSALLRFEEAVASFDRVLALRPRLIEALVNRGTALLALRRANEAVTSYEEALQVNPANGPALHGRANALFELKRFDEAVRAYEVAAAGDPSRDVAGILAFARLQCCDWRMREDDRIMLSGANLSVYGRAVDPFQFLAISSSPGDQKRCAEIWTTLKHPPASAPLWNGEEYRHERIRIAWLSADFRNHPVAQTLAGIWERRDRSRFQSIAISWGAPDSSEMRQRITRGFDEFITVEQKTDAEVARLLREREIDIAIDLMGFTADCRPGILAARPCPVQTGFLGFAGTMGAPYIDHLIADAVAIPDSERRWFSETVLHLPGSFFPVDGSRAVPRPMTRQEAGLPETGFVFACFNNAYKYSPEMFDLWMRLLRQVEGSVLWLSASHPAARRNLQREAELRQVDPGRLVFSAYLAEPERHLARLAAADLFLDTLPYNAHATAADALLAGVPVLTCRGATFAGRVAASLLNAGGIPELIAEDLARYEELALKLARDEDALRALRQRVAAAWHSQPLFDATAYSTRLETLLASLSTPAAAPSSLSTT